MRICHVITKPELGGAQLCVRNIISRLSGNGFEVSVITSPRGILANEFKNLKGVRPFFSPFLVRHINPLFDILALIHIYVIYRCNNYDAVHTHSSKAGIIGRIAAHLAGAPYIFHTVHGWPFNDFQPVIIKRFFILLEKMTSRVTTKIICVSEKDIRIGLRYKIAPEEKFVLVKYGIELEKFKKTSVEPLRKRKELGIFADGPVIGMISCLKPQKSPMDFVMAAIKIYEKMPGVNFLLVGDGVLKARCKQILNFTDLNSRFVFSGWRRDISEILDIVDILVLTSKWEGMPISIIEALAKGKPIVASNAGGTRELIKDGVNGFIVEPGSYKEVAEKVLKILDNPSLFNQMKKEASMTIDESFHVNRMVNDIEALYRKLT